MQQGSQGSYQVSQQGVRPRHRFPGMELQAFLSSWTRGVRSPVELRWGTWAFSKRATGDSKLPSPVRDPRFPFKSAQGNQALSRVEGGTSCPFIFWQELRRVPLELQLVRQDSSGGARKVGVPLESNLRGVSPNLEMKWRTWELFSILSGSARGSS